MRYAVSDLVRRRRGELEAMLIYSMSVSTDGVITDREGEFGWTDLDEEQFRFHLAQTRELGAICAAAGFT